MGSEPLGLLRFSANRNSGRLVDRVATRISTATGVSMTWLTYLEETFKAMTPGPMSTRQLGDQLNVITIPNAAIDFSFVATKIIEPKDAHGFVTLANLRHEILALIEAAIRFVPDERTIQWEKREVALREALTNLRTAVEKMREGK